MPFLETFKANKRPHLKRWKVSKELTPTYPGYILTFTVTDVIGMPTHIGTLHGHTEA